MEGSIRIAGTVGESIVDGPGFRYTLFTQGCPHHCPGCHNPQTHDFAGGRDMELEALLRYTFEELLGLPDPSVKKLLSQLDLLVDGRFIEAERNIELRFRGSENQRVLDVPRSLAEQAPVWAEQYR